MKASPTLLEDFDSTQLDALIGKWLMTAKKDNGDNYELDTLTSMHRAFDRYLVEVGYPHSILISPLFDTYLLFERYLRLNYIVNYFYRMM